MISVLPEFRFIGNCAVSYKAKMLVEHMLLHNRRKFGKMEEKSNDMNIDTDSITVTNRIHKKKEEVPT